VKFWILLFSAALFAGGTCLGVALRPTLAAPAAVAPKPAPEPAWGGWGRDELSVTRFAHDLNLSEEQDAELDRILEDTHRDSEAYGRAMRAAHERARDRVTELLTGEQKAKLDGLLADSRRRRSESEVKRSVDAYAKILKLSPEQTKAVDDIFRQARARRHEFYSEDKKRDRDSHRTFYRKLKEEQAEKLKAALAPEQFAAWQGVQELFDRESR
jgi:Spy/CpxP family protein refolding chaperone